MACPISRIDGKGFVDITITELGENCNDTVDLNLLWLSQMSGKSRIDEATGIGWLVDYSREVNFVFIFDLQNPAALTSAAPPPSDF